MDQIPTLRPSTPRSQSMAGFASIATAINNNPNPTSNNNNNNVLGSFTSSFNMNNNNNQNSTFNELGSNAIFAQSQINNYSNNNAIPNPPQQTSGRGKKVPNNATTESAAAILSPRQQQQQRPRSTSASKRRSTSGNHRSSPISARSNAQGGGLGGGCGYPRRSDSQLHRREVDNGIIGAKAAISALQHSVVGERSSTGMALEKQIAVNADVKSFAVVGSDVWMAHADGTLSVRDCRTGHAVDPVPLPGRNLTTCENLLGQNPAPWSLLAVTPLQSSLDNNASTGQAVTISGCTVWVGFSDGNIEVFDAETRMSLGNTTRRHNGGIYTLACFSNNVFSGSNDFQICMWDANDLSFLRQFSGHNNYVRCLHAEGALLFSGSDDCTIRVWNVTSGQEISRSTFHKKSGITALTRVGPNMWSGDSSGDIIVWRLQTMREDHFLREHTGRITSLKKVGRSRVYSTAADRLICVWDAFQFSLLHRVAEHNSWVLALAFPCSLTRHYVWTAAADATVRCFHHDEFTPMTAALEGALEGAWYGSDYAPYRDLSESQNDELKSLNKKLELLQESEKIARVRAGHLELHLHKAREEITEIDIKNHKELQNLQQMKAHFLDFQNKERDIYRQLHEALASRDQMNSQVDVLKLENERLAKEAEAAIAQRDEARMQTTHMESLLQMAVKAQQENQAASHGPTNSGGLARAASFQATRPGSALNSARKTTTSPRTTANNNNASHNKLGTSSALASARQPGSYFSGGQRPIILVTNSVEQAKVVAQLEAEIQDLNERIQRLQRVNMQMGKKPGTAVNASSIMMGHAGSFRQAGARTDSPASFDENQNPSSASGRFGGGRRDWTSQAMDILQTRQKDRENVAMAMSMNSHEVNQQLAENAQLHQNNNTTLSFIPQPPSF